jgi:hypothetical protein
MADSSISHLNPDNSSFFNSSSWWETEENCVIDNSDA